jgi:hypothetical protein
VAREVEEIEFEPSAPAAVIACMGHLASARDGWINLLPGVPEGEVDEEPRSVFSALFGSAQPPVSMCTWVPPRRGRRARDEQTVGIMHPKGRDAVSQLASAGISLPPGWWVRQDHVRRGLIVHPAIGAPYEQVLDWSLRSGAALTVVPLTGRWKAQVYLPRAG